MNKHVESPKQQLENDALKKYSPIHGKIEKGSPVEAVVAEPQVPEGNPVVDSNDQAPEPDAPETEVSEPELEAAAAAEVADTAGDQAEEETA